MARRLPDVEFVMVGSLFTRNSLGFGFSESSRQPDNLVILGHLEGKEKWKLLSSAWIMLSALVYEGLPVNYLDALQAELLLISVDYD